MANRLMLQCTLANGQKGMVAPSILRWSLDQRADAETVLARYVASAKHSESYAIVEVDPLGYAVARTGVA